MFPGDDDGEYQIYEQDSDGNDSDTDYFWSHLKVCICTIIVFYSRFLCFWPNIYFMQLYSRNSVREYMWKCK